MRDHPVLGALLADDDLMAESLEMVRSGRSFRGAFLEPISSAKCATRGLPPPTRAPTCSVFPSLTDTFGLVLLEALASGLPVAANPVAGPLDVIGDSGAGILDANLGRAALAALSIPRELARARALTFSLRESTRQFVDNVFAAHWDNVGNIASGR